jgi:hypothetical protein
MNDKKTDRDMTDRDRQRSEEKKTDREEKRENNFKFKHRAAERTEEQAGVFYIHYYLSNDGCQIVTQIVRSSSKSWMPLLNLELLPIGET